MSDSSGVVFPVDASSGRRSTAVVGRSVVAQALSAVDPVGAASAARETNWRQGYLPHFRRLVEAGLSSDASAVTIARDGIAALQDRMRWSAGGDDRPLTDAFARPPDTELGHETIRGVAAPDRTLSVPYAGQRLSGDALRRQVDTWVEEGTVEPSCAEAIGAVIDNPDWLDLSDRTVVVLGAAAEMGPLRTLLRWGADVGAVDLPRKDLWERLINETRKSAGSITVPVRRGDSPLAERLGGDLVHDLGAVTQWVERLEGPLVLGNYVYADGATNVRVSAAVDALSARVVETRGQDEVALAFLATPTDVFAVPGSAVARSVTNYAERRTSKVLRVPLRTLSGGRLLRRNYVPVGGPEAPGINDSVVLQQGPNYLLAKRLQRWRATAYRAEGGLRVAQGRASDAHPLGRQEPRARRGLRRRPPLRHRGLRARHRQHADGGPAGARPARRLTRAAAPLAGRGVCRGARWAVDRGLRPAQRSRARRVAGRRRREVTAKPPWTLDRAVRPVSM